MRKARVIERIEISDRKCSEETQLERSGLHLYLCGRDGGKVHEFVVYSQRNLFDTPENRVITSGLTLASA
jgi:hypothetical protein